jgi:DNA polymerase-3 subunit gamma/tau
MEITKKYRPSNFSSVVGQKVSVRILKNSITMNKTPSSILLSGLRGTGKTTLARIYSRSVNCQSFKQDLCGVCESCKALEHSDIWEFDSASRNGVDDIRDLSSLINQSAVYSKKVIILDEVHQLSKQAQSAFLKLLEEPPKNVIFVLVTTEPEKLEDTIVSRCLHLRLDIVHDEDMKASLRRIIEAEGYEFEEEVLDILVRNSTGSLRDIQKVLEKVFLFSEGSKLSCEALNESLGFISKDIYKELFSLINIRHIKYCLEQLEYWNDNGEDLEELFKTGIPNIVRDCMVSLYSSDLKTYSGLSTEDLKSRLKVDYDFLKKVIIDWEECYKFLSSGSRPKFVWEIFLSKTCNS